MTIVNVTTKIGPEGVGQKLDGKIIMFDTSILESSYFDLVKGRFTPPKGTYAIKWGGYFNIAQLKANSGGSALAKGVIHIRQNGSHILPGGITQEAVLGVNDNNAAVAMNIVGSASQEVILEASGKDYFDCIGTGETISTSCKVYKPFFIAYKIG